MNKLLVQLVFVISSVILISGCTSGGSEPAEQEIDIFFGPLPKGLPVFVEIVEPYFNTSTFDENAVALFSFKPPALANELPSEKEIFRTDSNIFVSLNTIKDDYTNKDILERSNEFTGRTDEFTLLVKNDSVYLVNHISNEIRLLNHFTTKVCEIIPAERVDVPLPTNPPADEKVLTVLHEEFVYVMTVETNSTCMSEGKRRYYKLPLDHQLELSADEDGVLDNLDLVMESQARSKLIFGWVPDENALPQDKLTYAYLGYGSEEKKLKLFDENRQIIWSQDRVIQSFVEAELDSAGHTDYFFHIEALENYQYLVQLGLDVFVVDAGLDLIKKPFNQINTILADRVAKLSLEKIEANSSYLARAEIAAKTVFDDENLLIIDGAKIYHLLYQTNTPARNPPSQMPRVVNQNPLTIDGKEHVLRHSFSQFDLKACEASDSACFAAQDISAQNWQFFTPCEEQYGCSVVSEDNDYCETSAENQQTQSNEPICSASNYLHISELNDASNDATLLAYMQYEKYIQDLDISLHNDRLYVTAKMDQKDVLLSYDYSIDFAAPKLLREHILFGKRATLAGMDAYFLNDSLFLTVLKQGASRSHECYKDYQKVLCDLGETEKSGPAGSCTGKDLLEGKCTDRFREYESKALFCSASQLDDLSCSDANLSQLNDLAIETEDLDVNEDAKWLKLYDYINSSELMYILIGDHDLALKNNQLDEGKLFSPSLYSFDFTAKQKGLVTSLQGSIEQVVGGWLSKDPESAVSEEVFGRLNVISEEVKPFDGTNRGTVSVLSTYLLEQVFEKDISTQPRVKVKMAPKVADRLFEKPTIVIN